jgi:hypothetical protein
VQIVAAGSDQFVSPERVREFRSRLTHSPQVEMTMIPELDHGDLLALHPETRVMPSIGISNSISISQLLRPRSKGECMIRALDDLTRGTR